MKKIALLLLLLLTVAGRAGEMLPLGSNAPELDVKKWVHRDSVTIAQYRNQKVVVLFFWALDNNSLMAFKPLAELVGKVGDKVAWIGVAEGDENNISKFKLTKILPFPVAVDSGKTVEAYMPPKVKYPACAIIAKDGRLVWRGSVRGVPHVLKRLLAGKLDINEIVRKEQFNISLGKAVRNKNFKEAVALIEKEQKLKFSSELTALHLQILLEAKDTSGAIKMLDKTIEEHPELPGPHLLRQMLFRSYFKDEAKAARAGRDSIDKLKKFPMVLGHLLQNEMKLSLDQRSPEFIYNMAEALYSSKNTLKPAEQGALLLVYAQAMNMCADNEKAVSAAAEAEALLNDERAKKTAIMLKNYCEKLNKLQKQKKIAK